MTITLWPARKFIAAVVFELRLRRDQQLLAEMDDCQLMDLGICRGQIPDAVRYGRLSRWLDGA